MIRKLLIASLMVGTTMIASADAVPKEIKSRYSQLHVVLKGLNFNAFKTFFSDDFVTVDPSGKSASLKEFLSSVKPMFDNNKSATVSEKLFSATKHDGMVDVVTDLVLKLKGTGGTTTVHEACTDTWKVIDKQWVMVKTVDTKFDITMPKPKKGKGKG